MAQIAEYEEYTEEKGIVNGVIDEDSKFLRELYHNRNVKNNFLNKEVHYEHRNKSKNNRSGAGRIK